MVNVEIPPCHGANEIYLVSCMVKNGPLVIRERTTETGDGNGRLAGVSLAAHSLGDIGERYEEEVLIQRKHLIQPWPP